MKISYQNDGNRSYMILEKPKIETNQYQERMFIQAELPGLLPANIRYLNGEEMYYYEIQAKLPITHIFEDKMIGEQELICILHGISCLLSTLSSYLLSARSLILRPECIYMNHDRTEVSFCYCPGMDQDCTNNFLELSEFLLEHVNHEEETARELAYQYDANIIEGKYDPTELIKYLIIENSDVETEISVEKLLESSDCQDKEAYYLPVEEEQEEVDDAFPDKKELLLCGGLVVTAVILYLIMNLQPSIRQSFGLTQKDYIVAGGVIAALFSGFIVMFVRFSENRNR